MVIEHPVAPPAKSDRPKGWPTFKLSKKKKWYDAHRKDIVADYRALGLPKTRKLWDLSGGTLRSLLIRWEELTPAPTSSPPPGQGTSPAEQPPSAGDSRVPVPFGAEQAVEGKELKPDNWSELSNWTRGQWYQSHWEEICSDVAEHGDARTRDKWGISEAGLRSWRDKGKLPPQPEAMPARRTYERRSWFDANCLEILEALAMARTTRVARERFNIAGSSMHYYLKHLAANGFPLEYTVDDPQPPPPKRHHKPRKSRPAPLPDPASVVEDAETAPEQPPAPAAEVFAEPTFPGPDIDYDAPEEVRPPRRRRGIYAVYPH